MENELATEHEFIELTDHGKELLKGIKPFLEENCDIMRYIEKVAETYSNVWVSEIKLLKFLMYSLEEEDIKTPVYKT